MIGKRLFDIVVAFAVLALMWPIFLVIVFAVRLDSPGPGFFRQERVGRHGRVFRIHKFRTMTAGPIRGGGDLTLRDDPRITRTGARLRHWKIDELPQFIDVLVGHMSLVGPRPEMPRYVAMYPPAVRDKVLSVRPGITDLASIAFRNESALLAADADPERVYVEKILPRKLDYYVRYVEERSFRRDLAILWLTAKAVLE